MLSVLTIGITIIVVLKIVPEFKLQETGIDKINISKIAISLEIAIFYLLEIYNILKTINNLCIEVNLICLEKKK